MDQKRVVVAGATGGIGRSICKKFAQNGFDVLALGRNQDRLDVLKGELEASAPSKVETLLVDFKNPTSALQGIQEQQPPLVSHLINAIGSASELKNFQEFSTEEILEQINVNLLSFIFLTRHFLPFMIEKKCGHIIHLGSVAGVWSSPKNSLYNASKSALRSFSESLRLDLQGLNIRVTNIEPGLVDTPFIRQRFENEKKAEMFFRGLDLLTPDDIAESVYWCSQQPARVNIQELVLFSTQQAGVGHLSRT